MEVGASAHLKPLLLCHLQTSPGHLWPTQSYQHGWQAEHREEEAQLLQELLGHSISSIPQGQARGLPWASNLSFPGFSSGSQTLRPQGVLPFLQNPFPARGKHASLGVLDPAFGALGWVASV